jgi:hypothetical protein
MKEANGALSGAIYEIEKFVRKRGLLLENNFTPMRNRCTIFWV